MSWVYAHRGVGKFFLNGAGAALPTMVMHMRRPGAGRLHQGLIADPQDVAALIAVTGIDIAGTRDRAIIAYLWDTGCRAQTILKLDLAHLNLNKRRAYAQEKGGKRRSLPFTEYTAALLRAWLAVRPAVAKTVFCNLAKRTYGKPMTSTSLHKMLKRLK